ncbi:MAG: hypothetical protein HYY49_10455 [Ignavibacteriales bacterium]|nr:hypothetical protein [Ignavibacteriales bacterium]
MRKEIITKILILTSTGLLACSQSLPTEPNEVSLYYLWTWQFSTGGFSGYDTLTPGRIGFTRKIEFTTDGTFKEFRNDSLWGITQFTITKEKTIFTSDSLQLIRFADTARFAPQVLWKLTLDELHLGDNHVEPYGHVYRRPRTNF